MSRKRTKKKQFSYTPTQRLEPIEYKTEWDLKGLYYTSEKDPRIEADLKAAEEAYQSFSKRWSKKPFTESATVLHKALTEYEALASMPQISRPTRYFGFRSVLNSNDHTADKQLTIIGERLRKASDQILFFTLTLGALPKKKQKEFLRDEKLAHFKYYLERLFLSAKHHLTEPEERIIRLKSRQSYGRWVDMTDKIISNRTIVWRKREINIPEALELLDVLSRKDKQALWGILIREMKQIGEVAEHEFNAIISDVRSEDALRGYEKPYSGTALAYEDTEKSIEQLVHAVSTKGFALSTKFYKLKAKFHKQKSLHYVEKYIPIGTAPELPFERAVGICRDVFYRIKPLYGEIFDSMLTHGQIDVFPKKGKSGGAFMSDETGHPVHVFLNHTNTIKSLETLAHEMGHAIHAHRSATTNTAFYDGHSITTAETASTLFENLLFDALFSQASESDKAILLHDRLTRDIATVQRQIAFFNCELEIHNTIATLGGMTSTELAACMQKHLRSYLGPAVTVREDDGYSYVYVPHLRYGFYVYTYAFGQLMSTIMAERYKSDHSYVDRIDSFLCAGQSNTVANIFKSIGFDTTRTDTFEKALDAQARDIALFEKLTRKR